MRWCTALNSSCIPRRIYRRDDVFFALDQFEQPTHRPGERQNISIERGIGKPLAVTKKRYLGVEVDDALEIVESIDV